MPPDPEFDVFLCHHSPDKPAVKEIAKRLKGRGLRPWLDVWELPPGRPWQRTLEAQIGTIRSAAVFIGAGCRGPWQELEIEAFLREFVKRSCPVIPVFLPACDEAPELPPFLGGMMRVDFRRADPDPLEQLIWGISGVKPGPRKPPPGPRMPPHNLPFRSLGTLLKGRDDTLREIAADTSPTAIVQQEAIHGLGGVGKTRLALEHAWRSAGRYRALLFVPAESPAALASGLAALAAVLGLPERQLTREAEMTAAVLAWLGENRGWLLIFDNADTEDAAAAVEELLPRLTEGHVIVTSRLSRWSPTVRERPLDTIPLDDAVSFLIERTDKKRRKCEDDPKRARRLAETLDGLPLALEQAAAYVNHHRLSFADYLAEWRAERARVLEWYDPRVMQYPRSLAVTWQQSFEQLGPAPRAILRLSAYLAPEAIPVAMFEEAGEVLAEALDEEGGEPPRVREALADLDAYSLIELEGESFTVHRMVQEVMRSRVPEERRKEWIGWALRVVNDWAPGDPDDVRTWPVWDPLRPHAARVIEHADRVGIGQRTTRLMNNLALLLATKALYGDAEPLNRRALEIDEASSGADHPEVARDLNNLAWLLKETNRLEEAEPLMRRALAIGETSFGAEHPKVAIQLNNLALLLQDTNRLEEAEPLMRRALSIDEASYGADHPAVARDLNNLAWLLKETNRLQEAEPVMRRALAIGEASFGAEHPTVARDLNNLAWLLKETNRLQEAEPVMRRALEILEISLGDDHPNTRIARENLELLLAER